jgi:hypothetical protein
MHQVWTRKQLISWNGFRFSPNTIFLQMSDFLSKYSYILNSTVFDYRPTCLAYYNISYFFLSDKWPRGKKRYSRTPFVHLLYSRCTPLVLQKNLGVDEVSFFPLVVTLCEGITVMSVIVWRDIDFYHYTSPLLWDRIIEKIEPALDCYKNRKVLK